jgi:hypothetical protein
MWTGLIERATRGSRAETIECENHSCLEHGTACSVVIQLTS